MNASKSLAIAAALYGPLVGASKYFDAPFCVAPLRAQAAPQTATLPTLAESWKLARTYEFGQSRAALSAIENAMRGQKTPVERAAFAQNLVTLLEPNTSIEAKRFACRWIKVFPSPAAIPILEKLLRDEKLSNAARFALESWEGTEGAEPLRRIVREGARNAATLPQSTLVGCILSLGVRRDETVVRELGTLAKNPNLTIASAAINALGQIGDAAATEVLWSAAQSKVAGAQSAAYDALLQVAENAHNERHEIEASAVYQRIYEAKAAGPQRAAALRGVLLSQPENALGLMKSTLAGTDENLRAVALGALRALLRQSGTGATSRTTLIEWLRGNTPVLQRAMLNGLSQIETTANDQVLRGAIIPTLNSPDANVRLDAIKTLATWGNEGAVPALIKINATATGAEKSAAQSTLERLRGPNIDTALSAVADKADAPAAERAAALRALGARHASTAMFTLLLAARDNDETVRVAALLALGDAASASDWSALLELSASVNDKDRGALERSLLSFANRVDAPTRVQFSTPVVAALRDAMARKSNASAVTMLHVLGALGSDADLATVRGALADATVREAAVRALSDWKTTAALDDLLALAKSAEKPAWQLLALRGAIRLIGSSNDKAETKIARLQNTMTLAQRPDEKKLVLAEVGKIGSLLSLQFVAPYLKSAEVQTEAEAAIVGLLNANYKASPDKKIERETLTKVLESKDERIRKSATDLLKKFGG